MNRETLQQTLKKFRIKECSTQLESLKGVDVFIEAVKPPKLNQRSYQLKQILTNKETEILIKRLLGKKKRFKTRWIHSRVLPFEKDLQLVILQLFYNNSNQKEPPPPNS